MVLRDLRLSLLSIRSSPWVSALVIGIIAVGIGSSVIAITLYHAKSGNPIWWKNAVLYRPLLDSRPGNADIDKDSRHPEYPPLVLMYRDALALYKSDIAEHRAIMASSVGRVERVRSGGRPSDLGVRFTTRDFFALFDVPFLHGQAWSKDEDIKPAQVVVITRRLNQKLFGGEDSVGRELTLASQHFRVIGVLDDWMPLPRFYEAAAHFGPSEDLFVPFAWAALLPDIPYGGYCQQTAVITTTFNQALQGECLSTDLWVELRDAAQRKQYRQFMDNYAEEQRRAGRFARPLNNALPNVSNWLRMNDVADHQTRLQVILALTFLGVCALNTLGLLLAKFLSAAPISGLRRALGATRGDIVRQHLIEVILLSVAGGVLGVGLAALGLSLLRDAYLYWVRGDEDYANYAAVTQSLTHMDGQMLWVAAGLSVLAGILASVYPAWRIGRIPPATFLKTQ